MKTMDALSDRAGARLAAMLRVACVGLTAVGLAALFVLASPGARAQGAASSAPPQEPPAAICGDRSLLDGPATAPQGAIVVPAGDNKDFDFSKPGATYWFAPGVHTLGKGRFSQIAPAAGATYLGGPGAVLDGGRRNLYAFVGQAAGVTIRHLTIRNFGRGLDNRDEGVVNHDAAPGWTIERNTISDNDGAAVFVGSRNVVRENCLKDNGQYGFNMYRPPVGGGSAITDIVLDRNEIAGNNVDDWESRVDGCGCTGGGKFWDVRGARVTSNWVHGNKSVGLWADTNDIDFLFEGNLIADNDDEGLWYEISYNATIRNNAFLRNGWKKGRRNLGSPAGAIYISESGGEPRLPFATSGQAKILISNNYFEDNFSGVSIYENANRFCNSNGNTSKSYCTPLVSPTIIPPPYNYDYPNPINASHPCFAKIALKPWRTDCRWRAQNVEVSDNEFRFDKTKVPCKGTYCGVQALIATGADNIDWSPYTVAGVQKDVMFRNANRFRDNRYFGDWRFAKGYGETISFREWQAAPYRQDKGSALSTAPAR